MVFYRITWLRCNNILHKLTVEQKRKVSALMVMEFQASSRTHQLKQSEAPNSHLVNNLI